MCENKDTDIKYMHRALELAQLGAGAVSTNPMVGAVIVCADRIIGEGYHRSYGGPHAEVNAVDSVSHTDIHLLSRSTMYVTLEPCSHWGKTPPCCDLIISKSIARVVIAMQDPFAKVNGEGIERMRRNGVEVEVGLLESEARELNRRFITYHTRRRPYILLKWARTVDGYMDSDRYSSEPAPWLTNYASKIMVHKLRAEQDAIWVGRNTIIRDNPTLTTREWIGNSPLRISVDNHNSINEQYNICNQDAPTIIFRGKTTQEIIEALYNQGVQSVLVEGGETLLNELICKGLFDEVIEFVSPKTLLDIDPKAKSGVAAPKLIGVSLSETQLVGNVTVNFYKH